MKNSLLEDLQWRGLIAQTTDLDSLSADLSKGPVSFYIGFDPTAPSLHVGNLVVLLVMKRFQLAGHKPLPLVGGATGLVGDPSGRNEERVLNDSEIVQNWVSRIRSQLSKFLNFDSSASGAVMTNNLDWTAPVSALSFLRDVGKHFSVNQMLSKDSVATRLDSGGISYTEFSYQVLQAFDYLELYRRHNCTLQLGGSDQWGNIVAGLDLIRKVEGASAHCLTIPLMTKSDGTKFGKTAGGSIWLDPEMTSPYAFYQFWHNSDDADIPKYLKVFSFKSKTEIESLITEHETNPGARMAHRALARELTSLVHGIEECDSAEKAAKALFGQSDLHELDLNEFVSAFAQLPKIELDSHNAIPTWIDLALATGIIESKSAGRRLIKEGGAYLNNVKITDEAFAPSREDAFFGRFLLLRKGKKELAAVELK